MIRDGQNPAIDDTFIINDIDIVDNGSQVSHILGCHGLTEEPLAVIDPMKNEGNTVSSHTINALLPTMPVADLETIKPCEFCGADFFIGRVIDDEEKDQ